MELLWLNLVPVGSSRPLRSPPEPKHQLHKNYWAVRDTSRRGYVLVTRVDDGLTVEYLVTLLGGEYYSRSLMQAIHAAAIPGNGRLIRLGGRVASLEAITAYMRLHPPRDNPLM